MMKENNRSFRALRETRLGRRGGVAVFVAVVLIVMFGFAALAVDIGYLMLSSTQMQSASDSASLAGGTELTPGLGRFAFKTPAEVEASARPVAQTFAGANRNAEQNSTYIDQDRDVEFGQAVFDPVSGTFVQTIGAVPYNMVRATVPRNQTASNLGDGPIPLFFARVAGHDESEFSRVAAAALFPADGFNVSEPGEASGVMPFAYKEPTWRRFEDAQEWYGNNGGTPSLIPATADDATFVASNSPANKGTWMYTDPNTSTTHEISAFHQHSYDNQGDLEYDAGGNPIWEQVFYDNFNASPEPYSTETQTIAGTAPPAASPHSDGMIELNLYPESTGGAITAGNAGTIDLGDTNNAAQAIADQIVNGLGYDDYQEMANQNIVDADGNFYLDHDNPTPVNGDTGISGGPIQQAMDQIIGQTRAIVLYNAVSAPGNNVMYDIVEFVGVRVLYAKMNGNPKSIWIQQAPHKDGTGVPDTGEVPGPDTTIFSPLILIE